MSVELGAFILREIINSCSQGDAGAPRERQMRRLLVDASSPLPSPCPTSCRRVSVSWGQRC